MVAIKYGKTKMVAIKYGKTQEMAIIKMVTYIKNMAVTQPWKVAVIKGVSKKLLDLGSL